MTRATHRPLRRVLGVVRLTEAGHPIERLECGHEQRARTDHIGLTHAYKRRCRLCGASKGSFEGCVGGAS